MWFYNYGGKGELKENFRYGKKWTLKRAVGFMRKAEVEEVGRRITGPAPGTTKYLGGYQKALSEVLEGLAERRQNTGQWQRHGPKPPHLWKFNGGESHMACPQI